MNGTNEPKRKINIRKPCLKLKHRNLVQSLCVCASVRGVSDGMTSVNLFLCVVVACFISKEQKTTSKPFLSLP